jgi:hypothetical protein
MRSSSGPFVTTAISRTESRFGGTDLESTERHLAASGPALRRTHAAIQGLLGRGCARGSVNMIGLDRLREAGPWRSALRIDSGPKSSAE